MIHIFISLTLSAALAVLGLPPAASSPAPRPEPTGATSTPTPPGAPPGQLTTIPTTPQTQTDAVKYWTPERLASATPLPDHGKNQRADRSASPSPGAVAAAPAESIAHATANLAMPPISMGRVYFSTPSGNNYCSASAVSARDGNLVLTAAHCLGVWGSFGAGAVFVPGYYGGAANPNMGVFPVQSVVMKTPFYGGTSGGAPDDLNDFAFLRVGSSSVDGRNVQESTGGALLLTSAQLGDRVIQGWGYNYGEYSPRTCTLVGSVVDLWVNGIGNYPFRALGCDPFSGGTSGGPFYAVGGPQVPDGAHPPILAGNVGGWAGGGLTSSTSYSVIYRWEVLGAYLKAANLSGVPDIYRTSFGDATALASGNYTQATKARKDVYAVWADGSVSVHIGTGNGQQPFAMPVRLAAGDPWRSGVTSASVGDFNHNKMDDLLLSKEDGTSMVYYDVPALGLTNGAVVTDGGPTWAGSLTQIANTDGGPAADDLITMWISGAREGQLSRWSNYAQHGFTQGRPYTQPGDPRFMNVLTYTQADVNAITDRSLIVRKKDGSLTSYFQFSNGRVKLTQPALWEGPNGPGSTMRAMTATKLSGLVAFQDDLIMASALTQPLACFMTSQGSEGTCSPRLAQY